MKCYLVGGAVRDKLLGLKAKDCDWVMVGATPNLLLDQGYLQFKNKFPVFLHPVTKEEYALARTEKKTGRGYNGFSFDISPTITLEEDLKRRDLTINAIAETKEGVFIDPFHGIDDLKNKTLRHISPDFMDDPARLLRTCRFLARYAHLGFHIANETKRCMDTMVKEGVLEEASAELIRKEMMAAFKENHPEKFFEALNDCGALPCLFPFFSFNQTILKRIAAIATLSSDPLIRFAAFIFSGIEKTNQSLEELKQTCRKLCFEFHAPRDYAQLSNLIVSYYSLLFHGNFTNQTLYQLFADLNLFSAHNNFLSQTNLLYVFITTSQCIAQSQGYQLDLSWLVSCAKEVTAFSSRALYDKGFTGKGLRDKLAEKRFELIDNYLKNMKSVPLPTCIYSTNFKKNT